MSYLRKQIPPASDLGALDLTSPAGPKVVAAQFRSCQAIILYLMAFAAQVPSNINSLACHYQHPQHCHCGCMQYQGKLERLTRLTLAVFYLLAQPKIVI
jgi:hypothetical protein